MSKSYRSKDWGWQSNCYCCQMCLLFQHEVLLERHLAQGFLHLHQLLYGKNDHCLLAHKSVNNLHLRLLGKVLLFPQANFLHDNLGQLLYQVSSQVGLNYTLQLFQLQNEIRS